MLGVLAISGVVDVTGPDVGRNGKKHVFFFFTLFLFFNHVICPRLKKTLTCGGVHVLSNVFLFHDVFYVPSFFHVIGPVM